MTDEKWEVVEETAGSGHGEILCGLLKAQGVPAILSQQGAGRFAYATTVGELGRVQILVPSSYVDLARQVLNDYHAGVFEDQPPISSDEDH